MKILNYTAQNIKLFHKNVIITFKSQGIATIFRNETIGDAVAIDGQQVEITDANSGRIVGLPEPKENTLYIVSSAIRMRNDRKDLISPTNFVYNFKGEIIGCRNFIR